MNFQFTFLTYFLFLATAGAQWVTTVAGVLETPGFNDGPALSARFFNPHGIAVDSSDHVYIADRYNHTIRKYDPATGTVITLAGKAGQSGSTEGIGSSARFNEPWGLCATPGGVLYVADTKNNKIRRVLPDGTVSTVAGSGNFGSSNGPAPAATFGNPTGIEMDAAGNLYVADHLTHIIRKISPNGIVSTLAGVPYIPGDVDGPGTTAQFWRPYGLTLDHQGNIIVADEWNHKIRRITQAGQVTTIAGNSQPDLVNGAAITASFNYPWDIAVDITGNIYVADGYNHVIRVIAPDGTVSTLAGMAQTSGGVDGEGLNASFSGATTLAWCEKAGSIYVGDAYNHLIRKITLNGQQPAATLTLLNLGGHTSFCEGDPLELQVNPQTYSYYRFYLDGNLVQEGENTGFSTTNLASGPHTIYAEAGFQGGTLTSNTLSFTVTALPTPGITAVGPFNFYEGDSVILLTSGTGTFLWSNGTSSQTMTVYESGTYFVEETANGCTGISEEVIVNVTPLPADVTVAVEGKNILCPGETTRLVSSTANGNQWLKDGWAISGATAKELEVSEGGSYQVRATDVQTGIVVISEPVEIGTAPAIEFDFTATPRQAQPGQTVALQTTANGEIVNWQWDFGDPGSGNENSSVLPNPEHAFLNEGAYSITLSLTDSYGCQSTLFKPGFIQGFENKILSAGLFIPTAFTPNGDGTNDLFRVRGLIEGSFYMGIFNQWGENIFSSEDPATGWDGNRNGLPVQGGTYVYLVKIQTSAGIEQLSGHITLLR